jgi:hypothetical protein
MKLGIGVNLFKRREQKGTPIRDGLVAEYRFDEGRGQVLCDYSGNGNHGTLGSTRDADTNDPLWTPQGLQFDGVDDYVCLGNKESIANIGVDGLTVTVVFAVSDIEQQSIVCRANPRGQDWQYQIRKERSLIEFRVWVWIDGLQGLSFPIVTYKPGVMSVAVTYDGINVKLYADGALVLTREYLSGIVTGQPTYIGRYWDDDTRYLDGEIYLAHFYNRALSPEEVLQNYEWSKTELAKRGVNLE